MMLKIVNILISIFIRWLVFYNVKFSQANKREWVGVKEDKRAYLATVTQHLNLSTKHQEPP
jgi:hypothetical protein